MIKAMERKGIDMIEVGIPFSDPLADGPVIQSAGTKALKNGMTVKKLFAQLKAIKNEVQLPLVLMGYLNPIMHYGIEKFFQSCVESGVRVVFSSVSASFDSYVFFPIYKGGVSFSPTLLNLLLCYAVRFAVSVAP